MPNALGTSCGAVLTMTRGTSLLACSDDGATKNAIAMPKMISALTKPAAAGTMCARTAFSSRTSMPSYGRFVCATSREIATRSLKPKSAGTFGRGMLETSCCVSRRDSYSALHAAHPDQCSCSASISVPVTMPSRYGEKSCFASAQRSWVVLSMPLFPNWLMDLPPLSPQQKPVPAPPELLLSTDDYPAPAGSRPVRPDLIRGPPHAHRA